MPTKKETPKIVKGIPEIVEAYRIIQFGGKSWFFDNHERQDAYKLHPGTIIFPHPERTQPRVSPNEGWGTRALSAKIFHTIYDDPDETLNINNVLVEPIMASPTLCSACAEYFRRKSALNRSHSVDHQHSLTMASLDALMTPSTVYAYPPRRW